VNYLDQSHFVLSMNRHFVECSAAGCFATAVVTTFFAPTRTLSVCNAGHPPPLVWRAATREWSTLDVRLDADHAGNLPLGIVEFEDCDQFRVDLDVGDLVLVYTDSLMEATDPAGLMLGVDGILRLARERTDPAQPQAMIPALLAAIDEHTGGGLRADDVTVLLLRANGTGSTTPLGRALVAPFKVLASVGRAVRGTGPAALPDFTLANLGGAIFSPLNRLWKRKPS
jgi:serine phosphatase RsbU (regulator of sigma subunit)